MWHNYWVEQDSDGTVMGEKDCEEQFWILPWVKFIVVYFQMFNLNCELPGQRLCF